MSKRYIEQTANGPVLIDTGDFGTIKSAGATDRTELDVSDAVWADLHKQLKTGTLDFAKVKENHKRVLKE